MKIIFLDKDGVVNSDPYFDSIRGKEVSDLEYDVDPKTIDLLEYACKETGAKIVVTASARYTRGAIPFLEELKRRKLYLDRTLLIHNHRGIEIRQWLIDNPGVEDYVIFDDEIYESYDKKQLEKLIKISDCNGRNFGEGLQMKDIEKLIGMIGKVKQIDKGEVNDNR